MEILGWRDVPVHEEILGKVAVDCMPCIAQCFIKRPAKIEKGIDFDRRLYVIRREFEQSSEDTYICSLSSRTIVYKGMFLVGQLRRFMRTCSRRIMSPPLPSCTPAFPPIQCRPGTALTPTA